MSVGLAGLGLLDVVLFVGIAIWIGFGTQDFPQKSVWVVLIVLWASIGLIPLALGVFFIVRTFRRYYHAPRWSTLMGRD